MPVSSFGNLGKAAEDVLSKYFKPSLCNFDYKSKTENNIDVHFKCFCPDRWSQTNATGDITIRPADGISVKTKIDDEMKLTNDIEISEKIKGTKHNIVCSIDKEGEKNLKLKSSLKQDRVNAKLKVDFPSKFPRAVGSVVVGNKGYMAGAKLSIETDGFEIKEYVYSLGYVDKGFQLHGFLTNHRDIDITLFQSHSFVDCGFKISWNSYSKNTSLSAAVMCKPNKDTFLKARVDEHGNINLAYGIKFIPGALLTVSAMTSMSSYRTTNYGMCLKLER